MQARERIAALETEVADIHRSLGHLVAGLETRLDVLEAIAPAVDHRLAVLDDRVDVLDHRTGEARLHALVAATEAVLAADPAGHDTLISVILPTRERPALLARAIASVRGQVHQRWELLVVDNGGLPATADVVAAAADERIRLLHDDEPGASRARNRGLAAARGELVAYQDDDNVMAPLWLRAVAVHAARHPEHRAFYGARVDDRPPAPARLVLEDASAAVLRARNVVDTGALAHRRDLGVRWPADADVHGNADWEVVAGLVAAGHPPLAIAARALIYTTGAPGRTSATRTASRFAHSRRVVEALLADVPTADATTITS